MIDISGWIWFVCGGCLGIVLAAVGMALAFIQERKEWKINFKRKDLHCAYLIGFEDGRKWGSGTIWKGK